jgi:hypothetical protein
LSALDAKVSSINNVDCGRKTSRQMAE